MSTDDITVQILRDIREELRNTREDLGGRIDRLREDLSARIDHVRTELTARIDATNESLADFRSETHANFAGVLMIQGSQRAELDHRVTRIEAHLGLNR